MLLKVIFPRFFIVLFRIPKLVLLSVLVSALILPGFLILNAEEDLETACQLEEIEKSEKSLSTQDYQNLLEKCQEYYKQKSVEIEEDLSKTQLEKKTLQNEIWTLRNKINKLENQIYRSNLMIKDLGLQVKDTESSIEKTSLKIEESQEKLVYILRTIYGEDQKSIVELLLSEARLSDFFDNLVALEILSAKNKDLLGHIKNLKSYLGEQKESLDSEKQELEDIVVIQSLQKQENAAVKKQQESLLGKTEAEYQRYLAEQEKINRNADEIRARIFEMIGTSEKLNFGQAYEVAKPIESITGVRSAFLLAIIAQESMNRGEFGGNVGQCFLKNSTTGAGESVSGKKIARVMKPTRDVKPFLSITEELGRDPYKTLVSCPMTYGWGGAMGPAQFIPSTWVLFREKVEKITKQPADPWDIKDAFLAAALYLSDLGAGKQTPDAEWKAAMRYFSGTSLRTEYNGWGFYGDKVIKRTAGYQKDIEAIENGQ